MSVVALLAACNGSVAASAPTINSTSTSGAIVNAASLTWSHTVVSGSNRLLLVFPAHTNNNTDNEYSGVTFGGVALTHASAGSYIEHNNAGSRVGVDCWYLVNPSVSTANIVVTRANGGASGSAVLFGVASCWNGVNQTTPIGTPVTNTGTSTTPSAGPLTAASGTICVGAANINCSTDTVTTADTEQNRKRNTGIFYDSTLIQISDGAVNPTLNAAVTTTSGWCFVGVPLIGG